MLKPRRTVVLAAVLGGFALTGVGVAQAQDEGAAPKCKETEHGYVCVQHIERTYTVGDRKVAMKSTSTCSAEHRNIVKAEKKASEKKRTEVHQKTTMECSSSISR